MKVLVTGSTGFLGVHVIKKLLRKGHYVNALVRPATDATLIDGRVSVYIADLRKTDIPSEAFNKIDAVIHLAAKIGGDEDSQFSSTVIGTENLLAAMARSAVPHLVLVSSLVVYSWSEAKLIMDESTPLESDIYSMGGYSIAKSWQERLARRHSESTGCKLTFLRPGFIWGKDHTEIAGTGRQIGRFHLVIGPSRPLPITYVENCAECVAVATESNTSETNIINIVDKETVSAWKYVCAYIANSRKIGVPLPIPYWFGAAIATVCSSLSKWKFGNKGKLPSFLSLNRYRAQFKPLSFKTEKMQDLMKNSIPLDFTECVRRSYLITDNSLPEK